MINLSAKGAAEGIMVSGERGALLVKFCAWGLMFIASLLNLLNFNGYPLWRAEVAIVAACLVAIALALTLAERAAPRLAFAFTALLVAIGADLNTDGAMLVLALAVITLGVAWFFNRAAVKVVAAAFASVTLFQLSFGVFDGAAPVSMAHATPAPMAPASGNPPIVHILLDSYLGTEGMAADPAFDALRQETIAFYEAHGFRLYDGAYSRHANTANSIPYVLSLGNSRLATESQRVQRLVPEKLHYFEILSAQGYDITVLEADFIDLCARQPVSECHQFQRSSLAAITRFSLSTKDRAKTIGITLTSMGLVPSAIYAHFAKLGPYLGGDRPTPIGDQVKLFPLVSVETLRLLHEKIARPQYDKVYFAHLLLPHDPYVFDEICNVKPRLRWNGEGGPDAREIRDADYRAQLRCTMRLLRHTLEVLSQTPAGREAIVIIHGDHGSRIVDERPSVENSSVSARDFAMTYSTMFAIRAPGVEPGEAKGRAAIDELLRSFTESNFAVAPQAGLEPAEIILATADWIPRQRKALPGYGTD